VHWQPITGIPCDVPVPRNVISTSRIAASSWHSAFMSATLTSLRIRNLALVEELLWEPRAGFVAVTGETGAGKSIILGALTLVLGERADRGLIRAGADACAVEAVFENANDERIALLLASHGAEPCEEGRLLLKRILPAQGAGRQFVNGSPCTLAMLRSLGDFLVDLHGPHDHQSLFSRDQQTHLLDSFSGAEHLCEQFASARRTLLHLQNEKASLLLDEQGAAREVDLLTHQVGEIEVARLQPGEEEILLSRQRVATNARRIGELCAQLVAGTSDDENSLTSKLEDLSRLARELVRLDFASNGIAQGCEAVFVATNELTRVVQSYSSALENESIDLASIEARLDTIQSLKRKYGRTVEDVVAFGEQAARKLNELLNRSERRGALDAEISAAEEQMRAHGEKLSALRLSASQRLAEKVRAGLKVLGFARSGFSVALENLKTPSSHGYETVEFLFSPNPGESLRALRAIASSGEISRVMLALKSALADQDDVPVLVFDEIDANVGGEIASKVGIKMRELGQSRQVLCITHLPQVAAAASSQFVVTKEIKNKRTRTYLVEASGKFREEEIARMLGGKSGSALAHARALLNGEL
jgi:DNA repair protein RecN (Recombination protein N)